MSIFTKEKPPEAKPDDTAERIAAAKAVLVERAIAEEAELLAKTEEEFTAFEAEWQAQRDGFSFEFRRYGDFLTIALTRKANPKGEQKYAETVNLGKVEGISFTPGRAVDREGTGDWAWQQVSKDKNGVVVSWSCWGYSNGMPDPFPLRAYEKDCVEVKLDRHGGWLPPARQLMHTAKEAGGEWSGFHTDGYLIGYTTTGLARVSRDDRVFFRGLGLTITAPLSLGEGMHAALLAELERGAARED